MVVVAFCWLQLGGPKGSWGCDGMCLKLNYLRIHHLKPREKTLDISWLEGCILSSWSLVWWYLWVHGMSLQGMILRGCLQKTGEPRKFSLKQQNVPRKSGYSHRFKPRISKFTWDHESYMTRYITSIHSTMHKKTVSIHDALAESRV